MVWWPDCLGEDISPVLLIEIAFDLDDAIAVQWMDVKILDLKLIHVCSITLDKTTNGQLIAMNVQHPIPEVG